jgi:ATP-dependent Lon protease
VEEATKVHHDIATAQRVLDEDHFGLEKVKERIVEYLAVTQRVKRLKGPILCLVGPPGVGKTSLGQSIARATTASSCACRSAACATRPRSAAPPHLHRLAAGQGAAEHGAHGRPNPLFLFDEVDKMSMDFRGDPSSALLEVLDPEQNTSFSDHYLEVDFDLSEVMFVCTANTLNIPAPLLDRMEVIRLPATPRTRSRTSGAASCCRSR